MRYIDAFNHFFPKRYYEALLNTPAGAKDLGKRVRGIPALSDLDLRLRIVESFRRLHAGALARPAADGAAVGAGEVAGDGEDRQRRPRRGRRPSIPNHFVGCSALLPMNAPEAAAKEAERALKNGANAVQLAHQRQRRAARRPRVLADLRGHRQVRQADPAASVAHPRDARLPDRESIEIRNLQRARLALRDRRDAGAAWCSPRSWTPIRT